MLSQKLHNFFMNSKLNKKSTKYNSFFIPENLFLIFSIIFGLFFVFITPPFQVPDENEHFFRAYEISDLNIIAKKQETVGDYLPRSLITTVRELIEHIPFHPEQKTNIEKIISFINIPLNREEKIFVGFPGSAFYNPVPYIPQVIGISIGKVFNFSPLILMYLGRLFNLFIWIFLTYIAIRISPIAKWLFFLLVLTPMSLFQAASLSADALTNSMSLLIISLTLFYIFNDEKQKIIRSDIFVILFLSVIIALSKQIYIFIPFLFALIPLKKFNNKIEYYSILTILVALILLTNIIWSIAIKGLIVVRISGVSPVDQLFYIIYNPINYIIILINTINTFAVFYIKSYIGVLGWLDTFLPDYIYISYVFMLFLVSIIDKNENMRINLWQKSTIGIIFCLQIILILTVLYLYWNKVGLGFINGLQGRNLIPLAPLFFLLFYNSKDFLSETNKKYFFIFITIYSFLVILISTYYLIQRYYN